ncbi:caspase recruitment domain-containing protein 8-like isoform X2 [Chrysemys picta bellii]|uniref:caspase recruitment domain-containing protein 8-like isoform X2 n=1 Tax=Chrysemys picta bellii TaxID=8478 RepID=UPI0032B1D0C4
MVAGPLFHIRAEPNTVRAVHLPHFVCLAGDVKIPAASSQTLPARGESFVKKHREQLRRRMRVIYPILARLRDIEAMNSDEEEEVLSMQNKQKVMNEALLQLVERKGARAQEELYQSLRETDPYLVQDLEQSS